MNLNWHFVNIGNNVVSYGLPTDTEILFPNAAEENENSDSDDHWSPNAKVISARTEQFYLT